MSIQLQEIQSIFISQNKLIEGEDYQTYDWLKADIPISTTMMKLPISSKNFEFQRNFIQLMNSLYFNTSGFAYFINNLGRETDLKPQIWDSTSRSSIYRSPKVLGLGLHTIIANDNGVTISSVTNTASLPWYGNPTYITFNNADNANKNTIHLTSSIKVDGVTRYVPCRLLRSIPASLDVNGIARTAGECGMVDSISGKFYGNVARSGAFTVKNLVESGTVENVDESGMVEDTRLHQIYTNKLVENVDYRCYDWLERKSSATSQMFNLTLSNTADTVVRIWNYKAQGSNGRDMIYLNNTNQSKYFIFPDNNAAGQTLMRHSDQSTSQVIATGQDVELTLRSGKVNNITTLAYNSISICPSVSSGNLTKVGRIYSDSYDYVPCKLLRAIPANRTMNGKSYPAGTMGMIEKVSKKFQPINYAATLTVSYDEWLKDCSIQFDPETTLGYSTSIPNDYVIYGRIEVAKLTAQYTDFGFMQASNNYIVLGESTVYAINDWGTNKWATFVVSYSGYECSLQLNGVALTTVTQSTPYNQSPHIQLHGIMQLNKIEHTSYPNESDPTQSHSEVWKRFVDEDGSQGLGISDLTYKIYAD